MVPERPVDSRVTLRVRYLVFPTLPGLMASMDPGGGQGWIVGGIRTLLGLSLLAIRR